MTKTKCGFCKGTSFEFVPLEAIKFARVYQCAKCGHPVGIIYDSEPAQKQLKAIAKDVRSLKKP